MNMHVHDLKNYWDDPAGIGHSFEHTIHHLRFGPQLPEDIAKKSVKNIPWTNHHLNPLDGVKQSTEDPNFNFMYFVKVVPTSYLPLGWKQGSQLNDDGTWLGNLGQAFDGSLETHQYSVTSHKRSLAGGDDAAEGHKERKHAQGGIPGVFFSYVSYQNMTPKRVDADRNTGYFTNEGCQPRGAREDVLWLSHWYLRCHWWHADGCRRGRSWCL